MQKKYSNPSPISDKIMQIETLPQTFVPGNQIGIVNLGMLAGLRVESDVNSNITIRTK